MSTKISKTKVWKMINIIVTIIIASCCIFSFAASSSLKSSYDHILAILLIVSCFIFIISLYKLNFYTDVKSLKILTIEDKKYYFKIQNLIDDDIGDKRPSTLLYHIPIIAISTLSSEKIEFESKLRAMKKGPFLKLSFDITNPKVSKEHMGMRIRQEIFEYTTIRHRKEEIQSGNIA